MYDSFTTGETLNEIFKIYMYIYIFFFYCMDKPIRSVKSMKLDAWICEIATISN